MTDAPRADNPPAFPLEVHRVNWLPPGVVLVRVDEGGTTHTVLLKNIGTSGEAANG